MPGCRWSSASATYCAKVSSSGVSAAVLLRTMACSARFSATPTLRSARPGAVGTAAPRRVAPGSRRRVGYVPWEDGSQGPSSASGSKRRSHAEAMTDSPVSHEKLGEVAVRAGELEGARGWFEKALAIRKALAAADPSNAGWQRDLSVTYEKLGEVAVSAGKLEDARGWFDKALAVRKALAAADPSNAGWQRDLSVSHEKLGDVAERAG